jgi:hypothetical protein
MQTIGGEGSAPAAADRAAAAADVEIAHLDHLDERNRMADLGTYIDEMSLLGHSEGGHFELDDADNLLDGVGAADGARLGDGGGDDDNGEQLRPRRWPGDGFADHQPHTLDGEKVASLLRRYGRVLWVHIGGVGVPCRDECGVNQTISVVSFVFVFVCVFGYFCGINADLLH